MTSGQDRAICLPLSPQWLESMVRPKQPKQKNQKGTLTLGQGPSKSFWSSKGYNCKKVVLAYLVYSNVFEIYTDTSSKQLEAVITQDYKPIAFFNWNLSIVQCKYSVTKIELLAKVKALKKFKGMVWGQPKKYRLVTQKSERWSRLYLWSGVPMETTARRVWAQDCLYQRHTQCWCRCNLTAWVWSQFQSNSWELLYDNIYKGSNCSQRQNWMVVSNHWCELE